MRAKTTPRLTVRTAGAFVLAGLLAVSWSGCSPSYGPSESSESQIEFGVDMAQRGLWQEALFRFQQADRMDPNNPRILNNIGVALEAAGRYEQALEVYQRAVQLAPGNQDLRYNYSRFVEFYQGFRPQEEGASALGFDVPGADGDGSEEGGGEAEGGEAEGTDEGEASP